MTPLRALLRPLLGLFLLAACGKTDPPEPTRNVLLLTLDTTTPGSLSCYPKDGAQTPHLDRLAREGVVFDNARTVAPLTLPAHSSMLTGLYPVRHSVRTNGSMALPQGALTLAERARDAELRTGAFVAANVLNSAFGISQGFEHYDEPGFAPRDTQAAGREERPNQEARRADEMTDRALAWLRVLDPDEPFLLWVHYFDPHHPYEPPPPAAPGPAADRRQRYLAEVAFMDAQIGRLLAWLDESGRMQDTFILAVGDHGEGLGRHGEDTHAAFAFDSTLRVPLLLRHPSGFGAGTRSAVVTSVVDVYPTLLEALGLPITGEIDGQSLYWREPPSDRGVYFEDYFGYVSFGWSQIAGWADAGGKLIHSSAPEFYAIDRDVEESEDLYQRTDERFERYRRAIQNLADRPRLVQTGVGASDDLPNLTAQIEMLGYAGAGNPAAHLPEPLDEPDAPAPHSMILPYAKYQEARGFLMSGRPAFAIRLLEDVVQAHPGDYTSWKKLGDALVELQRFREAANAFRQAADLREIFWAEPLINMGLCYENLGLEEEAIEAYSAGFAHGTGPLRALERLIALLEGAGREEEAVEYKNLEAELRR